MKIPIEDADHHPGWATGGRRDPVALFLGSAGADIARAGELLLDMTKHSHTVAMLDTMRV